MFATKCSTCTKLLALAFNINLCNRYRYRLHIAFIIVKTTFIKRQTADGRRQTAKGKRQKAKGKRQKAKKMPAMQGRD